MNNLIFCLLNIFLILQPCHAAHYSDFEAYHNCFSKDELDKRIELYLKKDKEIEDYYGLTEEAFYIYASAQDKNNNLPEFTLYLTKCPTPLPDFSQKKFSDLRIAIDPGHFGGPLAKIEQRYVEIPSHQIQFDEGTLTVLTAKALKKRLEKEGVNVLLTKDVVGKGVYEQDFWSWILESSLQPSSTVFRSTYNLIDLHERAKKINAFKPDLTIIIHYNVHDDPIKRTEFPFSYYNYNMVFVGGSFCKHDLKDPNNRYAFMRLLLTKDLDSSIRLSQEVLNQFTKQLGVFPVSDQLKLSYLEDLSIKIKEGIYARNLTLTRLVHGPLCYGESLCQDHMKEATLLNEKNLVIDNMYGPKRIEQVAQAYFEGIKAYFSLTEGK